jgi:glutamate dehydrogenase
MTAHSKVAEAAPAHLPIIDALADLLVREALPGEIGEFSDEERREAATFIADVAQRRVPGVASVRVHSLGGSVGHRRIRIGIVNDDMPFLVDSVANALAARDVIIHRLLHPVVAVDRDENCVLLAVRARRPGRPPDT